MGLSQPTYNATSVDPQGRNTPGIIPPSTSHGLGLGFAPSTTGHLSTTQGHNPLQPLPPNPPTPAPSSSFPSGIPSFTCNCAACVILRTQSFHQTGITPSGGFPSGLSAGTTNFPIQNGAIGMNPSSIPLPSVAGPSVTLPPPVNSNPLNTLPPAMGAPLNSNPVSTEFRPLSLVQNPLLDATRGPGALPIGLQPNFPDTSGHLMPMGSRLPNLQVPSFGRPQPHVHQPPFNRLPQGFMGEPGYQGIIPNDCTPFGNGMTCSKGFGLPPITSAPASVVPPVPMPPFKVEDPNDLATQLGYLSIKPPSIPTINPPSFVYPPQHPELLALAAQISADAKPYDTAAELVAKIVKARCLPFPNEWYLSIRTHHCTFPNLAKLIHSRKWRDNNQREGSGASNSPFALLFTTRKGQISCFCAKLYWTQSNSGFHPGNPSAFEWTGSSNPSQEDQDDPAESRECALGLEALTEIYFFLFLFLSKVEKIGVSSSRCNEWGISSVGSKLSNFWNTPSAV